MIIRFVFSFVALLPLLCGMSSAQSVSPDSMMLVFSTYVGGKTFEQIRDITCDREGNVYVTGGTQSADFPTTPGAYQRTFRTGGGSLGSSGPMDVFVVKYSPAGQLLWSTLLGGPNYDRAYAMEVDDSGYVYLGGRAGEGFPTTAGVLQEVFGGDTSGLGAYGKQDGFLAKISPDGSHLVWATYFGRQDGGIIRDMDIDTGGAVYLVQPGVRGPHPHVTSGAYQTAYAGGGDVVVAKVSRDASRVVWATCYGGSGDDGGGPSVRVTRSGETVIVGSTSSRDLPVSPGAYDVTYNGGSNDLCVAKFSADGSALVYGTYLGGSGNEGVETHNLAVDDDGNAFVTSGTNSTDYPITPGAFQSSFGGGGGDTFISKISSDGSALLGSTYVGGALGDFSQGIFVFPDRSVVIGGTTQSVNFPVTSTAPQKSNAGPGDFFIFVLKADFSAPRFASYWGGSLEDDGRTLWADARGNIYAAGQTRSRNWPLLAAAQPVLADTAGRDDGCLAKFSPAAVTTSTNGLSTRPNGFDLDIHPNPASTLATVSFRIAQRARVSVTVTDMLGRERRRIAAASPFEAGAHALSLDIDALEPGAYLVRLEAAGFHAVSRLFLVR